MTLFKEGYCIAIDCLNLCSLSFLSLALLEDKTSDILFFTSQNYLLVKSELNHLKIHSKIYENFQERVIFHFLKGTFHKTNDDFLSNFEKSVKAFKGRTVYFDRVDYFLDCPSLEHYEENLKSINKIVKKYEKNILYIYSSKSSKKNTFNKAIAKNTTILDFSNQKQKEATMPAFQALQEELLDELTHKQYTQESNSKIQIMLMSDNDELKKLHYYIFSSANDLEYYTIDILPEDEMSIIEEMDIILYNKKDSALKARILKHIKKEKLSLKFFEITNNDYLRQKDLLNASIEGVDKLFKKDFLIEDYIISIEMYLKSNFYSKRVLALPEEELLVSKKELYDMRIKSLLEKKIFFSKLTYAYESDTDISAYNLQKIVREYDTIYINKRKKEISFIILNTLPQFAKELIQNRIKNFSIFLEKKTALSSFDLIFD